MNARSKPLRSRRSWAGFSKPALKRTDCEAVGVAGPRERATRSLYRDARGLSTMEYAVLFVIIVVGAVVAWSELGNELFDQIVRGNSTVEGELDEFQDNTGDGAGARKRSSSAF